VDAREALSQPDLDQASATAIVRGVIDQLECLLDELGGDRDASEEAARARIGQAAKLIREADLTPDQVRDLAKRSSPPHLKSV
jgi:hypothetical protein